MKSSWVQRLQFYPWHCPVVKLCMSRMKKTKKINGRIIMDMPHALDSRLATLPPPFGLRRSVQKASLESLSELKFSNLSDLLLVQGLKDLKEGKLMEVGTWLRILRNTEFRLRYA